MKYTVGQIIITANEITLTQAKEIIPSTPIVQLGIQAPSGTIFTLNNGGPIEIGTYGIYELDLRGVGKIVKITFPTQSSPSSNIYIDFVREEDAS